MISFPKRNIPRMNVHQNESRRLPEHFRDVKGVGPAVAEHVFQALIVFFENVLLEVGDFIRSFRAGKIQDEWTTDDRHFDGVQLFVHSDQHRDIVTGNAEDFPRHQYLVYFQFPVKAVDSIEELDRREPIGSLDESILTGTGTEKSKQPALMLRCEPIYPRIIHAFFR